MKLKEKFKNIFSKEGGTIFGFSKKTIGLFALVFGNLISIFAISIAWFGAASSTRDSEVQMVTGDLNVKVNKVTAYKYMYPFYKNSTSYVDYDATGSINSYVIENNGHDDDLNMDYPDITATASETTITLGSQANGHISTDGTGVLSETLIHYPRYDDFRYYVVGDSVFCGDANLAWSTNGSVPFNEKADPTNQNPVVVSNVLISAGSKFIIFDRKTVDNSTCKYLTYASVNTENSPFVILNYDEEDGYGPIGEGDDYGTVLKCVKSGVYTISYTGSSLTITRQTVSSVISNNSADATLVKFKYDGNPTIQHDYTLSEYMAEQVNEQNTMLILDVELDYQNVNKVRAGLRIERDTSKSSIAITNKTNGYSNTTDYLTNSTVNASDFFSFYSVFVSAEDAFDASSTDATVNELWLAMHKQSDIKDTIDQVESPAFTKFGSSQYDQFVDCRLHNADLSFASPSSLEIEPSNVPNIYHCYIGIEYDCDYTTFFTDHNRLGKTYDLARDFYFHFTGVQVTE